MFLSSKSALTLAALAALGLAAARPAAAQDLNGQPVTVDYFYPDTSVVYQSLGTQTVTPGGAFYSIFGEVGILVTPTQITFSNILGQDTTYLPGSFNGFHVYESGPNPVNITSVTIDPATNLPGFNSSLISFDSRGTFVNFQSFIFPVNDVVVLDIKSAPVPEASTTASFGLLLALGLGGVVIASRRKKAAGSC